MPFDGIHAVQYYLATPDDQFELSAHDESFVDEFRRVLNDLGALQTFGLMVRKSMMELGQSILLEESSLSERLSVSFVTHEECSTLGAVPTIWVQSSNEVDVVAKCNGFCEYRDYNHTNRHTGTRGRADFFVNAELSYEFSSFVDPVDYQQLQDIDEIDHEAIAQNKGMVDELLKVIKNHGVEQRFAVCLLHKHFEVGSDEVVVEKVDMEAGTLTLGVCSKAAVPGGLSPSVLSFSY